MPLVYAGSGDTEPITEAHERARKVNPKYLGGELVRIAGGRNLAETELIMGLLLEEGIPSTQQRARGFDVPDFLAAGPRDVLVPTAAYEAARTLLLDSEAQGLPGPAPEGAFQPTAPSKLAAVVVGATVAVGALVFLVDRVSG